ncbi:PD-(D/E)XK nuclease family protein [Candidatus Kaiserbacteria bacterium]|nr:PD-(D/E)XK nuclease family protein [Candidatus Kaiserbacteria bacterium]
MLPPIKHWSHSSLVTFLRNPLAWYKRYVEGVYDIPASPSSVIGRAGHVALQHFYGGIGKGGAIELGLEHMRNVADFEINFGKARSKRAKKWKRQQMEREYLQAISFYLEKPPRYDVVGVEVKGTVEVEGLPLPLKAVSDLVVKSKVEKDALDIVDHKFVDYFSSLKKEKPLFVIQAIFNYYVVRELFKKPVKRFILHECKKKKNADGGAQLRRYVIEYDTCKPEFELFRRLITDVTAEISRPRVYLPNPSDMFEGEDSFNIYRLGLTE